VVFVFHSGENLSSLGAIVPSLNDIVLVRRNFYRCQSTASADCLIRKRVFDAESRGHSGLKVNFYTDDGFNAPGGNAKIFVHHIIMNRQALPASETPNGPPCILSLLVERGDP